MWGVSAAETAAVCGLRTREYGCRRNQFSSPSIRSGDTAGIQYPRVVRAHVRTFGEWMRFRSSSTCHECRPGFARYRFTASRRVVEGIEGSHPCGGYGDCFTVAGIPVPASCTVPDGGAPNPAMANISWHTGVSVSVEIMAPTSVAVHPSTAAGGDAHGEPPSGSWLLSRVRRADDGQ